jgi:hypothetical protein
MCWGKCRSAWWRVPFRCERNFQFTAPAVVTSCSVYVIARISRFPCTFSLHWQLSLMGSPVLCTSSQFFVDYRTHQSIYRNGLRAKSDWRIVNVGSGCSCKSPGTSHLPTSFAWFLWNVRCCFPFLSPARGLHVASSWVIRMLLKWTEVRKRTLGPETGCRDWHFNGFPCSSRNIPGYYCQATTSSFHILPVQCSLSSRLPVQYQLSY